MPQSLLCLYPHPSEESNLKGLYLEHNVHKLGTSESPFVYANFLSSLDGRIALEDIESGVSYIPKHLTTVSDFSLFMELHAQSDCLITHGGYMRALSQGRLGNILQVRNHEHKEWRLNNGLKPQPDVIIASASLNFPIHASLHKHGQTVYIATGKNADPDRIRYWESFGYPVLLVGKDEMVHGAPLIHELSKLGYKSIYLIAGPHMLDTVIKENQLSRLYLTLTHQLIGGKYFHSILPDTALGREGNLTLKSLYYEKNSPPGAGQFFLQFELKRSASRKSPNRA